MTVPATRLNAEGLLMSILRALFLTLLFAISVTEVECLSTPSYVRCTHRVARCGHGAVLHLQGVATHLAGARL